MLLPRRLCWFLVLAGPLLAGDSPVAAVRTTQPPTIDGIIAEAEWDGAARLDDFIQLEPRRGDPAAEKTVVYFSYDDDNLYFGVFCHDSNPESITARLNRRDDELERDDSVIIVLDTFHDRRTGYFFSMNPLGTQSDGRVRDDGRVVDSTWDAAWQSAAARVDGGWSAEFAIPFRVLTYRTGEDRAWGLNIGRSRRSSLETTFWYGPLEDSMRISQYGELTGLHLIKGGARPYSFIPYVQGSYQQDGALKGNAGLDFRWAIRPETTANVTVNPDFAIIEADQEFVNLTRYEVKLDEKRPFFLETNDRFRQRIQTFYSRRIEDIDVGGKLVSRNGPWDFTLLSTSAPNVVDPNAAGEENPLARANYTVGRAELGFLGSSALGIQVSNRSIRGRNSGSIGLDTTMILSRTVDLTGQLIRSHGVYGQGNWAGFVRPAYDTSTFHAHFRYTHLGDRFGDNSNSIGFVPDDDRREMDSDLRKVFWREEGVIQRVILESKNNIFWGQTGILRGYHNILAGQLEMRNRLFFSGQYRNLYRLFEKGFHNDTATVEAGYNVREFNSVSVDYETGKNFDSDLDRVGVCLQRKLTKEMSAEYQLSRVWLNPDPDDRGTWINVFRVQQNFTRDLYLKGFFQTNSVIDRRNLEIVFVWRYQPPFGQLQFAFQRGRAEFGERSQQSNTYFVKMSHVF
jgi:PAS domain-containing protein